MTADIFDSKYLPKTKRALQDEVEYLHQQRSEYNAGQHLLTLIDEILDLSRIEAGRVDLSIESVSLETILKDSLIWVNEMAESLGVSIDFDPASCRGMFVEAEAIRLKQVF